MDEFELIARFFDRKRESAGVLAGIGDDGAVLRPEQHLDQVQVIDTLIAGVHFPAGTDPSDIAYRAVAVNLSDIAAMGARPRWMTLALTLSDNNETWLQAFSSGLFEAADQYDVALVGGDTTRADIVTVTISMTGDVEQGAAILRNGAEPGDTVFVTGTIGDAAAGLDVLRQGQKDQFLVNRFLRPTARIDTGKLLVGKAHAAIDLSDGLVGDLKKILDASGVGAAIDIERIPLSDALRRRFDSDEQERFALTGGDDYELCFAAPAVAVANINGITAIGTVSETPGLTIRRHGAVVDVDDSGYRHF